MGVVVGVLIAVAVLGLAGLVYVRRRPRDDAGMTSFRRHIDALSPEARRDVHERVREHDERRKE
jgi:hypothetical protein